MVYCGSGTETIILLFSYLYNDSMVYCGSGTETLNPIINIILIMILWSTAEAVLRRLH